MVTQETDMEWKLRECIDHFRTETRMDFHTWWLIPVSKCAIIGLPAQL